MFGVDKVVNLLADWERYLAPAINDLALRDFGLLVAALALARLAAASFPRDTPLADGGTAA